jgi:hypothetical protein
MLRRKGLACSFGRAAALATVAALAAFEPSTAQAGTATHAKGVSATSGTSDATDISARRRYYRGGGGAAAAAAFAGIVGTGLAIAAASQDRGYYYGGPAYYGGGPYGPTVTMAVRRPTMVAVDIMAAGMATGPACRITAATRSPAGSISVSRSGRLARPAIFLCPRYGKPGVNTLATGLH